MDNYSTVRSYFRNKSVFITGGTGLVGKLFEFLPDVRLLSKIIPIEGDIGSENLGVSERDLDEIIGNVSIVYHSAATIRFTAPLHESINLNVCGTLSVINLCKKIINLEAFIHISTAFCNSHKLVCDEKVYECHVKPRNAIQLVRLLPIECLKSITESYLDKFPNTYTFTKNLAENLILEECGSIPTAILRPSIVTPTFREPVKGWIDSLNGISGGALLTGIGLIRASNIKLDTKVDIIPVDMFANVCIVATYATAVLYKNQIRVYNANSGNFSELTNGKFQRYGYEIASLYPFSKAVRPPAKPQTTLSTHPIVYIPTKYISEIGFAYLCDKILGWFGQRKVALRYVKRFHKVLDTMKHFSELDIKFTNDNLLGLENILNEEEKDIFNFDLKNIDWKQYFLDMYLGSRKYLLKEKHINIGRDRWRMKKYMTNKNQQLIKI